MYISRISFGTLFFSPDPIDINVGIVAWESYGLYHVNLEYESTSIDYKLCVCV